MSSAPQIVARSLYNEAVRSLLYALAAATFGCSPFGGGAFTCTDDLQCARSGTAGTCQPNGYCSFLDDSCPSGQRYGDSSGGLGGVCVGDEPPADARPDTPMNVACVIGGLDLCEETPLPPLQITASETLNTDTDPRCITFAQAGGGNACLVYATEVSIGTGVTLSAIGSRPLIIASAASIALPGELDVSSRRGAQTGAAANDAACTTRREAENDLGGAAGAGGGSFHGKGGDGGDGDTDNSLPQGPASDGNAQKGEAADALAIAPTFARGGCRGANGGSETGPGGGNGGAGGNGGGAVWLVANDTIDVGGAIRATGAGGEGGGDQSGGGGGGSGGFIKLAATTLTIGGSISANGGGGGEGGCRCSGVEIPGNPGADGVPGAAAAGGGTGASDAGGDGGASGATPPNALAGAASEVGAGGGGGGAGFIVFVGAATVTGVVSPPAQ
jgi:hypothetical protein